MARRPSIVRALFLAMMGTGLAMGLVFPLVVSPFAEYRPGLRLAFAALCIVAGLVVGVLNFLLVRRFLLRPVDQVSRQLESLASGEGISATRLALDSDDALGRLVLQFNALIDRLQGTLRRVIETVEAFVPHADETGQTARELVANVDRKSQVVAGTAALFSGLRQELLKIEEVLGRLTESAAESRTAVGAQVRQIAAVNEQIAQLQGRNDASAGAMDRAGAALQRTSGSTQELTLALEAASASMTEIDVTVREIDRNLKESTVLAERVATDAAAGDQAVGQHPGGHGADPRRRGRGRRGDRRARPPGRRDSHGHRRHRRRHRADRPARPECRDHRRAGRASTAGGSRSSPTRSGISPTARRTRPARSPASCAPSASRRTPPSPRWGRAAPRSRKAWRSRAGPPRRSAPSGRAPWVRSSRCRPSAVRSGRSRRRPTASREPWSRSAARAQEIAAATAEQDREIAALQGAVQDGRRATAAIVVATREQELSARRIEQQAEAVAGLVESSGAAVREGRSQTDMLAATIETLQDLDVRERGYFGRCETDAGLLAQKAQVLRQEIERFKPRAGDDGRREDADGTS